MITTENLITKIKFGNDQKANIAVGAIKGTLTLQMLATEKQIGDKLVSDDIQELPKVEIEFFNTKSIDVLISALEVIKRNYTPPPSFDQLALAC
jgi:hypothetical protein